jgi:hypothetical protein
MTARELYLAREKRINDAISLQRPDRVPVVPLVTHYYAARVAGISNKDAMFLHEKRFKTLKELTLQLNWDAALTPGALISAKSWEILGITQFKWPGGELDDNAPFQFIGSEIMKGEEYDAFLADPDGFTLYKILPRISTVFAPLGQIPLPPAHWLLNTYNLSLILPQWHLFLNHETMAANPGGPSASYKAWRAVPGEMEGQVSALRQRYDNGL